jgi:S-adenosylmethionine hydrolase
LREKIVSSISTNLQFNKMPIITLTTDFGLADEYVGVMKGVILSKSPKARLVDLTHAVPPYNISMAAYLIYAAHSYFAAGTIHVVVVDPGVGSSRDIIVLQANQQIFVAPDNGILTMFLKNCPNLNAHKVTNQDLLLQPLSHTFHGRDIFAPIAAHLSNGAQPRTVGAKVPVQQLCQLNLPQITLDSPNCQIKGTVIHIDHFGNVMTNISQNSLSEISKIPAASTFAITVNKHTISPISQSYQELGHGEPLLIFNSRNLLEISINSGHAAQKLNISINDQVTLTKL